MLTMSNTDKATEDDNTNMANNNDNNDHPEQEGHHQQKQHGACPDGSTEFPTTNSVESDGEKGAECKNGTNDERTTKVPTKNGYGRRSLRNTITKKNNSNHTQENGNTEKEANGAVDTNSKRPMRRTRKSVPNYSDEGVDDSMVEDEPRNGTSFPKTADNAPSSSSLSSFGNSTRKDNVDAAPDSSTIPDEKEQTPVEQPSSSTNKRRGAKNGYKRKNRSSSSEEPSKSSRPQRRAAKDALESLARVGETSEEDDDSVEVILPPRKRAKLAPTKDEKEKSTLSSRTSSIVRGSNNRRRNENAHSTDDADETIQRSKTADKNHLGPDEENFDRPGAITANSSGEDPADPQNSDTKASQSKLPIVYGGMGASKYEGNILFSQMLDSRREEYMEAKNCGDKDTTNAIMQEIANSFRFVDKFGNPMTMSEACTKIYKNIADHRILDKMRQGRSTGATQKKPSLPPVVPPPVEPEVPEESVLLAEYDASKEYIEELEFHTLACETEFEGLDPLAPPPALPELPADQNGRAKYSFYDKYSYVTEGYKCRIVHVDCTGLDRISQEDKQFIGYLMERNDLFVLFQGLCRGIQKEKILLELQNSSSPGPFPKVRRYDRVVKEDGSVEYIECDKMIGMAIPDYIEYLNVLSKPEAANDFQFTDLTNDALLTIKPSETCLYMTDVDMTDRLTVLDDSYRRNFLLHEILPGGEWCMMNRVRSESIITLVIYIFGFI